MILTHSASACVSDEHQRSRHLENESGKEASINKKVMSLNSSCDAESGRKGLCRGPGGGGEGVAQPSERDMMMMIFSYGRRKISAQVCWCCF